MPTIRNCHQCFIFFFISSEWQFFYFFSENRLAQLGNNAITNAAVKVLTKEMENLIKIYPMSLL